MKSLIESDAAKSYDWTLSDVADLDKQRKKKGIPLVYEKEVIYAGDHFMGDVDFSIDDQMIDHWELVCSEMIADGIDQPVTVDHTTDPEKRRGTVIGWKTKPDSKGRKALFAEIKFRDKEAAKLASTAQVSLASPKSVTRGGKTYPRGIEHVAITDYPCILGLDGFTKLQLSEPLVLCEDMEDDKEEGKKKECPECAKRKKMKAKREKKKRLKRRLLALSETPEVINGAVRELAEKTGERIAVVPQVDGTLILAESMLTDDMNPTHLILCGAGSGDGGGFGAGNTCAGGGDVDSYKGQHESPDRTNGAPLHDMSSGGGFDENIYSVNAIPYFGTGDTGMDQRTLSVVSSLRGKPDMDVVVYRAVPEGASDEISPHDWVALTNEYANLHGSRSLDEYKVITKTVKAKQVFGSADSIHEFGYDPTE